MKHVDIATPSGMTSVPAFTHEKCKHLCVTMAGFGRFEVTHIASGTRICSDFERASSAIASMMMLSIALIELGLPDDATTDEFRKKVNASPPLVALDGVSFRQLIEIMAVVDTEFPWESPEDSPFSRIDQLEKELNQKVA